MGRGSKPFYIASPEMEGFYIYYIGISIGVHKLNSISYGEFLEAKKSEPRFLMKWSLLGGSFCTPYSSKVLRIVVIFLSLGIRLLLWVNPVTTGFANLFN